MKSTIFALASLLASAVAAGPHAHQHRHPARHQEKRAQDIVWVTDYDYVTEVIPVTETVWVSEGFVPPTSPTTTTTTSSASSDSVPAQFFQPVTAVPTTTSSSVYVAAPPPASTYVAPPPAPTTEAPAPVPTTTQAYVPPPPTSTYVAPPPAPTTAAPAPVPTITQAAPVPQSTTSSPGGVCAEGSPCSGDITFYDAGLGACGWVNDGTENVVALPFELMGTQSNGNPYCGRMVAIKCSTTGKTTTAKVVDKCMGCFGYSIDLSNNAFGELAEFAVGRTTAEWWFTS